jgi:phage baseplate assembly protein gpV
MVEIVFAGGEPLRVAEPISDVVQRIAHAPDGGRIQYASESGQIDVQGWAIVTPESGLQVLVNPAAVAFVRP